MKPVLILNDQPVTCPGCGARTEWLDGDDGTQHHTCLGCGDTFLAAEETGPDFSIENHLSLVLVRPLTAAANEWLDENVVNPDTQWFAGALVCEPRYVENLVAGIEGDGLVVA